MCGESVEVKVCVKPRSKRSEVVGFEDGCLVVKVTSPPIGGRANEELIKLLKRYFKAKRVTIVKGERDKVKIVLVEK